MINRRGAATGALFGAGIGGFAGYGLSDEEDDWKTKMRNAAMGAGAGAGLGGLHGARAKQSNYSGGYGGYRGGSGGGGGGSSSYGSSGAAANKFHAKYKGMSEKDLKKAYRADAKKYHPDMNNGSKEAEEMFKHVNEAYHSAKG